MTFFDSNRAFYNNFVNQCDLGLGLGYAVMDTE